MKFIQILIAIVIGLAGLAMSTCGLAFTVAGLNEMAGIIVISIPALLIGCGLLWLAKVLWTGAHKPEAPVAPAAAPEAKPPA